MTVDLMAATFWPEAAPLGSPPMQAAAPEPAPRVSGEEADAAARRESLWSAMLRCLWAPADAPAAS